MKKSTKPPQRTSRKPLFAEADLLEQLHEDRSSSLWLGRFSEPDIWRMWEQCGFRAALEAQGLRPLLLQLESVDAFMQALKLYYVRPAPEYLLAEFRLRETVLAPRKLRAHHWGTNMPPVLAMEWLLLQNPQAQFHHERPALPGQAHPGLGQARRILHWLVELAQQLALEGISNYPEYFHNAYLYQSDFHFYDPAREGLLDALSRDLRQLSLAEKTWAIERGWVHHAQGEPLVWESDLQVLPLSPRMRDYFASAAYRAAVVAARETWHFNFASAPR